MSGAKMIVPSWFQLPPRAMEVSQMVSGGPPCASIFLSLESAKNPMERLSGDQKGKEAPSVPSRGRADRESSGRTHRSSLPSGVRATKASRRPSGDTATGPEEMPPNRKADFSGGRIEERMARSPVAPPRERARTRNRVAAARRRAEA